MLRGHGGPPRVEVVEVAGHERRPAHDEFADGWSIVGGVALVEGEADAHAGQGRSHEVAVTGIPELVVGVDDRDREDFGHPVCRDPPRARQHPHRAGQEGAGDRGATDEGEAGASRWHAAGLDGIEKAGDVGGHEVGGGGVGQRPGETDDVAGRRVGRDRPRRPGKERRHPQEHLVGVDDVARLELEDPPEQVAACVERGRGVDDGLGRGRRARREDDEARASGRIGVEVDQGVVGERPRRGCGQRTSRPGAAGNPGQALAGIHMAQR